ncbi:glutathione peroxidase [Lysinibacillus sp. 2017]|uniref:glutathione peroxidase n=1 Tax=unclassified Lysinibacillus TaxID=2636778 RepID=UPI000D52A7C7|nr:MULTISPECIES: glutathione peroxidase [unclassified Lysinibacillus]AWE06915.1 glutathione peroxidase [Lysinibacillus sp. 2017]TGN37156.1 glutathione peroxidase [Lysinibacillus sp. S2017]
MSIYNYLVKKPNGEILSMETYRDEVMLIVNTANHCQFTYQYEDLQKLYERYASKGFKVLSFPCNQFGEQNPEDGETSAKQCKLQYGVNYPVFEKVEVNGEQTHPLFKYLKHEVDCPEFVRETLQQKMMYNGILENYPDYLLGRNIRWNFTKFLVDRNGHVLQRFEPDSSFLDIEKAIESVL